MHEHSQLGIREMANLLEVRKDSHHPTVLLLGARAGRLFRSTRFYDNLQLFSNRNFQELPLITKFQECYAILTSDKFSETDIHSILQRSLKDIGVIDADMGLASLIKHEYFDEVISTNIDDTLEDALLQTEMKEGQDFEVISIGRHPPQDEKSCLCRITKVYGELVSRDYTVKKRASHLDNAESRNFLQSLLKKDLLIVGMDLAWDKDILRVIPVNTSGSIWFACEEEEQDIVEKLSFLSDILRARSATHISGTEGNYEYFMRKLHEYLCGNISLNYPFVTEQSIQNIQQQVAKIVDILEQLTSLKALLPGINDHLRSLQNNNDTFFGEIQKIQKKLEDIEKHQGDC
jgi:hypothetical protein